MTDTTTQVPEAWELDSGLRDDMVLSIHGAYFAPHAEYQEGKQLMIWLLGTDENDEPAELRMSIGSDWQTPDGGNTITHPTKKKQHINKSCIYGHWISYCFEIPDLAKTLIERGGPTDARIWVGLIIHLQAKTLVWGGDIKQQKRHLLLFLLRQHQHHQWQQHHRQQRHHPHSLPIRCSIQRRHWRQPEQQQQHQ